MTTQRYRISRIGAAALGALVLILSSTPATAADFTVDSATDASDALPGDGVCATLTAACSLRAAVQEANELAGADRISLPAGAYALTLPGPAEDAAATGDLDIAGDLAIEGADAASTVIDGRGLDRILDVLAGSRLDASGIAFRNGFSSSPGGGISNAGVVTLTAVSVIENRTDTQGGGIFNAGDLSAADCDLGGNTALNSGGAVNFGTMIVTRCAIRDNAATAGAGGIGNAGTLRVESSTFTGNVTGPAAGGGLGGGLASGINSAAHLAVFDSTFSGNTADAGGGMAIASFLVVANSTLSGNVATGNGGGVAMAGSGSASFNNVTITGNSADSDANGSGNGGGFSSVAGSAEIDNSIIAGNADSGGESPDCFGQVTAGGFNLIERVDGCTILGEGTGNVVGQPAGLGPLEDHGGDTSTHALLFGSPAVDAGSRAEPNDVGACEAEDQRGLPRPRDGDGDGDPRCDIGAFERKSPGRQRGH